MTYEVEEVTYSCGYEEDYEFPSCEEKYEFDTEEKAEEFIKTRIKSIIKEYMKYWDYYYVDEDDDFECVSLELFNQNDSSYESVTTIWRRNWLW